MRTFGGIMMVVEALNAVGVALAANPSSQATTQSLGKYLTIAAMAIQVVVILSFVALASAFHVRLNSAAAASDEMRAAVGRRGRAAVMTPLRTLYASMALILVRCVYRLVEHANHKTVRLRDLEAMRRLSPLMRYEWYFYVFEASLMLVNSVLWNVWHPGRHLPASYQVHLAQDGTEVHGDEKSDERPLLKKAGNVLTFGMLWRRKEVRDFQELREYPAGRA